MEAPTAIPGPPPITGTGCSPASWSGSRRRQSTCRSRHFKLGDAWFRRTGFFALVALEEYATGKIRPHEETLSKPKTDRLALLEACRANFSPIFACYEDAGLNLQGDFERAKEATPQLDLVDDAGVSNRLWVITDPVLHQKLAAALKDRPLYIADGHHRYETALNFYRTEKDRCPGAAHTLMYLVPTGDPGLVILPTHRIVHSLPYLDLALLKERLQEDFVVEKTALTDAGQALQLLHDSQQPGSDGPDHGHPGTGNLPVDPEQPPPGQAARSPKIRGLVRPGRGSAASPDPEQAARAGTGGAVAAGEPDLHQG